MRSSRPIQPVRNGFTLIELLVVIAIIAILAAILFPVFAQAKAAAKKSQSLSNTKQTGTAFAIYLADADDLMPLAYPFDDNGTMLSGPAGSVPYFNALVPANAQTWNLAPLEYIRWSQMMWANSIQPYMKNIEIMDTPFSIPYPDSFYQSLTSRPLSSLPRTHMTMNGLLNQYSSTAITSPSTVPLIYYGNGKESYHGRAYTSPYLRCRAVGTPGAPAAPCMFNPSGAAQAGQAAVTRGDTYEFTYNPANDTTWTHGEGFVAAFADTSAKFLKTTRSGTNTGNRAEPGYTYDTRGWDGATSTGGGSVVTPARCFTSGSSVGYLSWFRPDQTSSYALGGVSMAVPCNG
jgi:prepilin-type N-terminal cleavage/methylation domain-containing protein